jgi:chromate reductase
MPTPRNVAVLVGSLCKASFSRRIALAIAEVAAPELKLQIVEIGGLPLYGEDLDAAGAPASWEASAPTIT